jgi:hypothetical protein
LIDQRLLVGCCLAVLAAACGGGQRARPFPRSGLAVSDTAGAWCAEFQNDSTAAPLRPGDAVTIVLGGSVRARIAQPRASQCYAAFPQPRWLDYVAYDLSLIDSVPPGAHPVALVVSGESQWTVGGDSGSMPRADLDADGKPETLLRCTADEGEYFTLWTEEPDGKRTRRWLEYYDWGAFTDPKCPPEAST